MGFSGHTVGPQTAQLNANQDCMATARAALERNWIVLFRTWDELAENRKIIGKSIEKSENHGKTMGKCWLNVG